MLRGHLLLTTNLTNHTNLVPAQPPSVIARRQSRRLMNTSRFCLAGPSRLKAPPFLK
jgi:hypothetical protein